MLKKISIYFIISVTGILLSISVLADTHINVLPGVNVEVGEEVYFDGLYYYQDEYGISVNWEWDFGDGYTLKAGTPRETTFDTGLCVVHYFMKPGTYEVQLTVSRFDMDQSPPVRQELLHTDSVTIHVTGEALMEGFELRHAPFRVRTAQYLYALVPSGYSPEQVSVRLETAKGDLIKQLEGVTVDGKRRFLLENAKLPAGDYVVVAELKNGKETVSTIREKFSKPYDGAPAIGINENNAFVLIGEELFFPIGPWQLRKSSIPMWKWSSNILYCIGYYDVKDEAAWQDYVKTADSNNLKALGPVGWVGFNKRNGNPDIMAKYIEAAKDLDGLFGWCWDDEPNLGGRYNRVPATVLAAWSYRVNQRDPQHPTVQQYYGYDYLPNYNPLNGNHEYSYMRSAHLFGGKKAFTADFITYDIYPIENKGHASLKNPERGVIDLWAEALDNFVWNMDNLIPLGTFVETQNVTTWDRMSNNKYETEWDAGPTPGDLRTQLWTSIVHNMKAVLYFEFFAETPMDNMSVLNEFYEAVTDLTPIILAPPSSLTVTHNCHERGKRVDLMVRETDTDYYIFAVRITEPESEWNELMEPETIEFVLDTGTKAAAAYDIFPGYRWEHLLVDVTEEKKSFQFDLKDGVRPGSVLLAVVDPKKISDKIPEKLVDMWTGKEYSGILDKQGIFLKGYDNGEGKIIPLFSWENIKGGTINYETGEMTVELKDNVPLGEDFIQISYAVEDRPIRTITGNNGVFRDTLERNAVRIYRIPKQVKPVIITQPEDQIAAAGGNIRFSVEAAGTDIHFQWQKDTGKGFADLRGKTDATLLLTNVRKDDEGLYRVRVYNNYGDEVYSEATRLEVTDPLPKVIEPDSIAVNKTVYHFWNNPEGQGEIWDKVYVIRKEGSEPLVVDDDSASVVYDGTGTSFIDTNLDEGIYYYAFYTYKDIGNNVVYSGPEVAGPVEIPAKYNKECVTVKAGPDQPLSIGQNTRGDLYSFWNEEKISIGRGPTGNESSLWFYSDIIGNGENQVPAKSKIVSARLVFHVEGYNFNEDETSHDLRDRTRSIELYRITDPDNLGRPYYAKESGIRAGLDYNYRDHRPGMKIPWIATEEEENYSGIADLLREIEPVDIIEFTADVFEDEGIKTLEFDVTEAVQAWADGAENQGIYITTGEGWDNGKYLELYGVDMEGAGQPGGPYLEIVYGNSGDLAAPGPVENISISTGTDSITLNWDNPSDTDFSGVRIVRKKGMIPFSHQDGETVWFVGNTDKFTDTGLDTGETYYYALYAHDGEHNYSEKAWIKGTPGSPAAPVMSGNPVVSGGSAELYWNTVEGAEGYRLYRQDNPDIAKPGIGDSTAGHINCIEIGDGSVNSYKDYLQTGTYTYWLTAVNEFGEGPVSNRIELEIDENNKAAGLPGAPSRFTGQSISGSRVNLSWKDNSDNESGFVIERKCEDGEWEEIYTTVYDVTEFIDRGLRPGTKYHYRIKAVNSAGESDYAECTLLTAGIASISWEVISASHIRLYWKDRPDESDYTVKLVDQRGNIIDIQYLPGDMESCILRGLEPEREYRAVISANINPFVEDECITESDIIRTSADPKGGF